ncbi:MAG: glycosyltransferase, partial [Victivallales bacterium]|nr:glycosyltransferase [Victivallales bacterium]
MKVLQIVPSIGEESSGPSYSVPGLCSGLNDNGVDVSLAFGGRMPNREFRYSVSAFHVCKFPHPRLGYSPSLKRGLISLANGSDVVHNNGLWMFANVYCADAAKSANAKLVMAPRGCFAEWCLKHHSLQKRLFGIYAQNKALRMADMFHATSEKEYEEIRAQGYRQPVAIVPIGMDLPEIANVRKHWQQSNGGNHRVVFFGRLHKVKAVDNLVLAWGKLADRFKNWELVIAGPDGGVRDSLRDLVATDHIPRVSFKEGIYGFEKYEFLSSSDIYVLPSHTENFGVTVAEALACGTPVIASQGTPWKDLDREGAGRCVPIGVKPLVNALSELLSMTDKGRLVMGKHGQE